MGDELFEHRDHNFEAIGSTTEEVKKAKQFIKDDAVNMLKF
jgi:hypothetical protein